MKYIILFAIGTFVMWSHTACELFEPEDPTLGERVRAQLDSERNRKHEAQSEDEKFWMGKKRDFLIERLGEPTRKIGAIGQGEIFEYDLEIPYTVGNGERSASLESTLMQNSNIGKPHWSRATPSSQRTYEKQDALKVARLRFFMNEESVITRMTNEKLKRQ